MPAWRCRHQRCCPAGVPHNSMARRGGSGSRYRVVPGEISLRIPPARRTRRGSRRVARPPQRPGARIAERLSVLIPPVLGHGDAAARDVERLLDHHNVKASQPANDVPKMRISFGAQGTAVGPGVWGREVIEFFSLELTSSAGSLSDVKTEGKAAERAGAGRSIRGCGYPMVFHSSVERTKK